MTPTPTTTAEAGLWALGIVCWFVASVLYRRHVGKPIFASRGPGDVFVERWVSGRAGDGLLARLGTGRNCLQVRVTATHLLVHPHFPASIGFIPEVYGLDRMIPLPSIRGANILGGRHAQAVEVAYRDASGRDAVLQLLLRQAPAFLRAVSTSSGPQPTAPAA